MRKRRKYGGLLLRLPVICRKTQLIKMEEEKACARQSRTLRVYINIDRRTRGIVDSDDWSLHSPDYYTLSLNAPQGKWVK